MSLEAVHDLSIQDLLHVLNEKLGLEWTRIRDILPSHVVPFASLESDIDSLETRARDVLRFIPSLRNTLRPVNRLPPEILSCIARGVRDDFDEDMRAIIPLTRVCRHWRESIISTPENWSVISSYRRNFAALSLERAKAAPLEIYIYMGVMREDPQFLDLPVPHFQNTQTLRVTGLLSIKDLFVFSQHPMINLRSLMLSDLGVGDLDRSIDSFELSAHALRYLDLVGVPLYPSFLNIRTLTWLNLFDHQCNLHLDTFLDILEENRSLTSAKLRIWFIEPSLRSSRRRAPIENQLKYLRISCDNPMDGQALISGIALSKGAELEFTCRGGYGVGVNDVLSNISTTYISNLLSPLHAVPRLPKDH